MPRMTKVEKKAEAVRRAAILAEAQAVVRSGKCPKCGAGLRSNLALTGWWQCAQYGADGFRADKTKPACSFQCFTV